MPQLYKCYFSAQECQMCMRFLETLVIFSKYIQLLVVTWKTLRSREEKERSQSRKLTRAAAVQAGLGWLELQHEGSGRSQHSLFFLICESHSLSTSWLCCVNGFGCPGVCACLTRDQCTTSVNHGAELCAHTAAVPPAQKGFCSAKCRAGAVSLPSKWALKRAVSSWKGQEVLIALCSYFKLVVHCHVHMAPCISSTAQLSCC